MRYVAFIRAVMVGREGLHRDVMLATFRDAGAVDPVSHLATGNVTFDARPTALEQIVSQVDAAFSDIVGRTIEVFVRDLDALRSVEPETIYAKAPFEAVVDRLVSYFHEPPDLGDLELPALIQRDRVALLEVRNRDVYSVARVHAGQRGAPGGQLEKLTGQRVTTRGWSTVQKIIDRNPPN